MIYNLVSTYIIIYHIADAWISAILQLNLFKTKGPNHHNLFFIVYFFCKPGNQSGCLRGCCGTCDHRQSPKKVTSKELSWGSQLSKQTNNNNNNNNTTQPTHRHLQGMTTVCSNVRWILRRGKRIHSCSATNMAHVGIETHISTDFVFPFPFSLQK